MRIFQSVSGHSSEQSVTRYSSQPTASQLYGVSDTIPKWFRNLQSFNNLPANQSELRISIPPSLTLGSFHSKLELNDLQYWPQPQVFQAYFFNCCNIQGNVQAFLLTGLLWSQQLSVFSSFSSTFVDFAIQVRFHSTRIDAHDQVKFDSGVIFLGQSNWFVKT